MKLEVNHNDATFDSRQIKKNSMTFTRVLAGTFAAISLWSGSILGPLRVNASNKGTESYSISQSIENIDESKVIDIPVCYQSTVRYACGKNVGQPITVYDLKHMDSTFLTVKIQDDSSLEWLNYINGVEILMLFIETDNTSALRNVSKIDGINSLSITGRPLAEITPEDFGFLTNSKQIEKLSLYDCFTVPGFLESLTHLKKLSLSNSYGNYTMDFKKMTFLNELLFPLGNLYDVAIYLTSDEYQILKNSGVNIDLGGEKYQNLYKNIDNKLNGIVANLGVTKDSSDIEKLDAILIYVLEHLTYDKEVSNAITLGIEHSELSRSFYKNGNLYGALEKDTAICGNYTALTNALAERLGLESYYLTSSNHAWSLVEVEGQLYYVDSTWLDGQSLYTSNEDVRWDDYGNKITSITYEPVNPSDILKNNGDKSQLVWYMEDPNNYPKSNDQFESHEVNNLPKFYRLMPQEETSEISTETKPIKLDDEKIGIKINGKVFIVSGVVAVGLLVALGGAIAIKNKKNKQRRIQTYNDFDSYYDSGNSYSGYGKW